jgi:hypothetical protein
MRQRVIELDPPPDNVDQLQVIDEMLVCIYRDEFTDVLFIRIHMGSFDFRLKASHQPCTRSQAIELAREFIQQISYTGKVQWKLGDAGPITDEPKL